VPDGMRAPTVPIGAPDVIWGQPGAGGLLTEWAESVPDLMWPESVRTFGRMRRDARLASIMKAFFLPILRSTWVVDPAGVDRAEAVDLVAGDLGLPILGEKAPAQASPVRGFSWHEHLRLAMLNLIYGHMPFEQWYEYRGGRTHLAGLQERQPHTIAIIDIDPQGYVRQVYQNTQEQPIPANRLLWYCNEREGANYAGVSLLRPCYTSWVLKHETMRVHATSIRRFGMGVPGVEAPPGATPGQITQAQQLASQMRVGDQSGAGLPSGFKFSLTGLTGSVPDAVGFLQFCNQEMTGSALAQIVELAHSTYGSRAVGESFLDLFLLSLQAVADQLGATATFGDPAMPGIARSLVEYNWGPGEPVPRIVSSDVGERHEATATAISALVTSGALMPDAGIDSYLRQAYGLPARSGPYTPPAPKGGPKPPPGPQPAGGGGGQAPPGGGAQPPPPGGPAGGPAGGQPPAAAAGPLGSRTRRLRAQAGGLRRELSAVEAAAGFEPELLRDQGDRAVAALRYQWEPVQRAMMADIAEQVAAAVDGGRLHQVAAAAPDTAPAAALVEAGMQDMAWKGAMQLIREAAAQGVVIDPRAVRLDDARIGQVAQARAGLIGARLAAEAGKKTLSVVAASAGSDAAGEVTTHLAGLSDSPLEDQLLAAMTAAQNMGRIEAAHAGMDLTGGTATATEILDQNTCGPCEQVDGRQFASIDEAEAAYPSGGYRDCAGMLRCRGTIVINWDDGSGGGEPGSPAPVPAAAAAADGLLTYPPADTVAAVEARLAARYPGGVAQAQAEHGDSPPGQHIDAPAGKVRSLWPQPGQDTVDAYREQLAAGGKLARAWAVAQQGYYYLVRGNHQAVAHVLEGATALGLLVLDLGAAETVGPPAQAARPKADARERRAVADFDPGQARDGDGKWTSEGGGAGKPGRSIARMMDDAGAGPGREPLPADLVQAIDGAYGHGGLKAKVWPDRSFAAPAEGQARIRGEIQNADGEPVGEFVRRVLRVPVEGGQPGETRLVAENYEMEITDPTLQGQGFASAFNAHMEDLYREAGVHQVRLTANLTVGGFAWARTGFDFAAPSDAAKIADTFGAAATVARMVAAGTTDRPAKPETGFGRAVLMLADDPDALAQAEEVTGRAGSEPFGSDAFPLPFDYSQVGYRPGAKTWPGRELLLGAGWNGVKTL
jgi:hypothetical protein